jgi:SAM-dependent methyltransferase
MTAVDLGCGEGRNAMWLASRGWHTTGVDFSAAGIEVAAARAAERNFTVQWEVADATTWQAHSPVDLVVCAYLQLPEQQLRQALARAAEALAPGGRLLLIGHHVDNLTEGVGGPQREDITFSLDVLADAVSPLVIESVERLLRPVATPDGIRQAVDATLIAHAD